MNREILFRGKRVDNGEWIYGRGLQQCKDELGNEIVAIFKDVVKSEKYIKKEGRYILYYVLVNPETFGQYTGLTDKEGNKIFEGDIVHLKGDGNGGTKVGKDYYRVVTFHEGSFCISIEDGVHYPVHTPIYEYSDSHNIVNWDVVGNITDNPELIKKSV